MKSEIEGDHEFLGVNWYMTGYLFDNYIGELYDLLDFTQMIQEKDEESHRKFDKKLPRVFSSIERVEKSLSKRTLGLPFLAASVFSELEFEENTELCLCSQKAARFMTEYFNSVAT